MSWGKKYLGDICNIEKGNIGISKAIEGEFPLVVTSEERKSHNEYQFDDEAVIIPLVSSTGHGHKSIKRIHYQDGKFAVGNILCAVIPKDKSILNAQYLYRYLNLNKENELVSRMKGMANVTLPIKEIANIEISLPNIDEQFKLVERVNFIEEIKESLTAELTRQLDLVKKLRQQLLQDAVKGKLVPQNAKDEPASELLKKIKAEKEKLIAEKKLKKEKELSPIKPEEIPFEIPENWVWCNLGEIAILNARIGWKGLNASEYKKEGPLFLSVHSLNYGDYVDYSQAFHISQERYDESPEIMLKDNDILICKDGAGIGKLGIIKDLKEQATTNSSLLVIRCFKNLNVKFIYYYLTSSHFQNIVQARIMGATTPHLYQRDLVHFYVALPPLAEQNRIVQKLDELMQYCNELEASIKQSESQNEKLLQQVLREALRKELVEI